MGGTLVRRLGRHYRTDWSVRFHSWVLAEVNRVH